jgi:Collagen triple helix repeat (20 copies)
MRLEKVERETVEVQVVRGPKGDTGPTGPRGPQGEQGPPGQDGKDGRDGTDGRDGVDGRDGRDGKDGLPGRVETVTIADLGAVREVEEKLKSELDRVRKALADLAKRRPEGRSGGGGGSSLDGEIVVTFDGGGSTLTVGNTGVYYTLPYNATIEGWYLTGDPAGSLVVDIWRLPGAIPTDADSITASAKPTLASVAYGSSKALNGWKLACAAGDVFGFEVESATSITKAVLTIKLQRI